MLTLRRLLAEPSLELALVSSPDEAAVDRELLWLHPTELPDPSSYVRGGELVLTNGVWLDQTAPDEFVAAVRRADGCGIVFGLRAVTKTGRTHLMDAMPLTVAQEFGAWSAQLSSAQARIEDASKRLRRLPIGGTAIGTGINADPRFGKRVAMRLSTLAGSRFESAINKFEGLAAQDDAVELSGQLNALSVALMKIGNDLRWMNSGPLAGFGEIELPALQPGSSIMPGKVNPVLPEALCMVCAQVMGHHVAITIAGASGNFQLNVMLPLIAHDLLDSIELLSNAMRLLADKAIAGIKLRRDNISAALDRNPILVTALNPIIGYEKAAAIAKRAYKEGRPVLDVALEDSGLPATQLKKLLDPTALTRGGIQDAKGGGG